MAEVKNAVSGGFRFFRVAVESFPELYSILSDEKHAASLPADKGGFSDVSLQTGSCSFFFREITANEILVLSEGQFKRQTFYQVEDAFFALFRNFAIVSGKPAAVKIGSFTVAKHAGIEFRPCVIPPKRLFDLSDHMSQIKAIDFEKMKHPVYRKVKLDGAMETIADIAPFHEFVENVKSVKGVMNTPEGVRTIKLTTDGRVSISKKKDETLSEELLAWLFKLAFAPQTESRRAQGGSQ